MPNKTLKASEIDWNKILRETKQKNKKTDKKKSSNDELKIPLPKKDPGFFDFCKLFAFPRYEGLFKWQKKHHEITWNSIYEETLVPRGHGKTVQYTQKYEWAMQYQDTDILLLGWTDKRKQCALDVYTFFKSQDLIDIDRRSTPYHFRILNGSKFDCYLITSKDTLGMHSVGRQNRYLNLTDEEWDHFESLYREDENKEFNRKEIQKYVEEHESSEKKLWISIDDPIDISFMKEKHKEDTLELHFDSSLYPIHPDKWSFTGTHKFIGDFFTFVENKFGDELVKYKRSTINENGELLCPERYTHPDLESYEEDLLSVLGKKDRIIRDPKIDLAKLRKHVGEYTWWSEYEQNPHPITGDIWDHIRKDDLLDTPIEVNYDICWITIDRATTTKTSSSYTGCLLGLRHKHGYKVITHDWSKHTTLEELLIRLNNFVIDFKKRYGSIRIIMIVEKQGGGDDFLEMCRTRSFFMHQGKLISNKLAIYCELVPLHNIGEKKQRIHDRLYLPIKNELIGIMSTLEKSEIYVEILRFPYSNFLDGIDALANMEYELQKIPLFHDSDPFLELGKAYEKRENLIKHIGIKTPEEKEIDIKRRLRGNRQRNIFDDF